MTNETPPPAPPPVKLPRQRRYPSEEGTLPGIGTLRRKPPGKALLGLPRRRRRVAPWVLVGAIVLGLAAQLASLRYPQLVGPINLVREFVEQLQ